MNSVFIVGCGYVGKRLAREWLAKGITVTALARSQDSAERLAQLGIRSVFGDLSDIWSLRRLNLAEQLLYYLAPPPRSGTNDLWMREFVTALKDEHVPKQCVLVSTTGVYGDRQGAWVDEKSEVRPGSDRARRRLDAERIVHTWGRIHGFPVITLRVAGIYGPDRLPLERLRSGVPVISEKDCPFTNRIHANDLVQTCMAAAVNGRPDNIYNACDGHPGTMTQYFNAVADAFGLQRPPVVTIQEARDKLTPEMLSYLSESRRVRNNKMLDELGVKLRYPHLEDALTEMRKKNG